MGDVRTACELIQEAKEDGSKELDLNSLDIKTAELKALMPEILTIPNLEKLNLTDNLLTTLPDTIGALTSLKEINLTRNEIESLPESVENLNSLEVISLYENDLRTFPVVLTTLPQIREIDLCVNFIEELPRDLRIPDTLEIRLTDNSLSDETLSWINNNFPNGNIETDMAENEEVQSVDDVLNAIYPDNATEVKNSIESLNFEEFTTANFNDRRKIAAEVLNEFLSKTPYEGPIASEIYLPVAKGFIDTVMNPEVSREDKSTELQKMATSLGNCATPVKSFLIQNAVDQQLRSGEELTPLMQSLLDREAVEDRINTVLKGQLRRNEKIEQVQALVNAIFMPGAENKSENKIKITGDRERLPSKTSNVDYGFEIITPEHTTAFAQLFCETDTEKVPAKNTEGTYSLDPAKLKSVTSAYRAKLGIISNEERSVMEKTSTYETQIVPLVQHDNLLDNPTEKDVLELMDIPAQKEDLRIALYRVPENKQANAYQQFLQAQKDKIAAVVEKYKPQKIGLARFMEPVNKGRRPPDPDGGGKRKTASDGTQNTAQKRHRGPGI